MIVTAPEKPTKKTLPSADEDGLLATARIVAARGRGSMRTGRGYG